MSDSHRDLDGLAGAFIGISTIIVGLRLTARQLQKTSLAADDYLMGLAYLTFIGFAAAVLYGTHHRTLGYSTPELKAEPALPKVSVGVNRAIDALASAYFGLVKASALLFFRRVFCIPGRRDAFSVAIWVLLALTLIWSVLYILLPIFQCGTHISTAWGPVAQRAKYCKLSNPYLESQSVTDVAFDLAILVLPLPKIWSLNTNVRRRLAIMFVFSTAAVSLAAGIAKTVIVFQVSHGKITGDVQLATTRAFFMWVLEAGFAMIAVNLPTLVWLRNTKSSVRLFASVRSFFSVSSSRSSAKHRGDSSGDEASSGKPVPGKGGSPASPNDPYSSLTEDRDMLKSGGDFQTSVTAKEEV